MDCRIVKTKEQLLHNYWLLEEACSRITTREDRLCFAPDVYCALLTGDAQMTLVLDGEQPVGLFVTRERLGSLDQPVLHVWIAYVRPGAGAEVMEVGLREAEMQAAERGRPTLAFTTRRRGWMRLAERLGYEMTELRFEKQVTL